VLYDELFPRPVKGSILKGMPLDQKHLPMPSLLDPWLRGKSFNAGIKAKAEEEKQKLALL